MVYAVRSCQSWVLQGEWGSTRWWSGRKNIPGRGAGEQRSRDSKNSGILPRGWEYVCGNARTHLTEMTVLFDVSTPTCALSSFWAQLFLCRHVAQLPAGLNSGSSTGITHSTQEPAIQRAGNPDMSGGPWRNPSIITTSLLSPVTWFQHHREMWIHLLETFDNLFSPPAASLVARMVKNICSAGDLGSIPELGRTSGEENGNPLQYSCPENSLNRGAQWAIVHGVAKSRTGLNESLFLHSVWLTAP